MGNRKSAGHLAALFTIIIWGTTFISTKVLLVDFRPVEILFFRFVIGFMVAMAGVMLISFNGSKLEINPMGDILAVAGLFLSEYNRSGKGE